MLGFITKGLGTIGNNPPTYKLYLFCHFSDVGSPLSNTPPLTCNLTDLGMHVQPIKKSIRTSGTRTNLYTGMIPVKSTTNLYTGMIPVNSTTHSGPMTNDDVIGDGPALIPC